MKGVALSAYAKINLGLSVLGKRPDGYHELATVMQCVTLADTVTLRRTRRGISLSVRGGGRDVPAGPENLCWRAARLFLDETGTRAGVRIALVKRIPSGAGLGGGSSDAAAVLSGMDRLFGTRLGKGRLSSLAARLGSDIPFFIHGPAALCLGRGEIVRPIAPRKGFFAVLVKPEVSLPTPRVYARLGAPPLPGGIRLRTLKTRSTLIAGSLRRGDIMGVARRLENDLETAALSEAPALRLLKERLTSLPFLATSMSGSGSAHFGIARSAAAARALAARCRREGWGRAWAVRSTGRAEYGRVRSL